MTHTAPSEPAANTQQLPGECHTSPNTHAERTPPLPKAASDPRFPGPRDTAQHSGRRAVPVMHTHGDAGSSLHWRRTERRPRFGLRAEPVGRFRHQVHTSWRPQCAEEAEVTADRSPTTGPERGRGAPGSAPGRGEQVPTLGEDGGRPGRRGWESPRQRMPRMTGTRERAPLFTLLSLPLGRELIHVLNAGSPRLASPPAVLRESRASSLRRPPLGQGWSPAGPRTEGGPWGLHRLSPTCNGPAYNCLTLQWCQSDTRNKLHELVNAPL